ncbi:efflux RND transporter permease subunit [Paenibacillus pabuli]|nr:efflux RND transporter permease subunit [Paenibacillus pabuli]
MARLDQLGTIQRSDAISSIQERDGQPDTVVQARIISSDISGVSKVVNERLHTLNLPKGVAYSLGGITQQVTQMIFEMIVAVVISMFLIMLITNFVFGGWRKSGFKGTRCRCHRRYDYVHAKQFCSDTRFI